MTPILQRLGGCLLVLHLALAAGCASKPPPTPLVAFTITHFNGSPLSGPTTQAVDAAGLADAVLAEVRTFAIANDRIDALQPVGSNVRLISKSRGGVPLIAAGQLTESCRLALGDAALQVESQLDPDRPGIAPQVGESLIAIPPSATASLQMNAIPASMDSPSSISLLLHRVKGSGAGDAIELAIVVDRLSQTSGSGESTPPNNASLQLIGPVREVMILNALPIDRASHIAVLIPFDFKDGVHHAVLASVTLSQDSSNPRFASAISLAQENLAASAASAARNPMTATLAIAAWPGYQTALAAIHHPTTCRTSMIYLAGQTGAHICEDAALVANDSVLAAMTAAIDKEIASPNMQQTADALGWAMDAAVLKVLADQQGISGFPPEMTAVLLRHTGQAGANAGSVGETIAAVGNRHDFEARILADNLVYLEDNSPAARVRAFDWLTAQGKAPAGYDPLASPKQRQDALQKEWDAMAAKQAAQAQQGGRR